MFLAPVRGYPCTNISIHVLFILDKCSVCLHLYLITISFKLYTFPSLIHLLYSHIMYILQHTKLHLCSLNSYHVLSVKSNSHTYICRNTGTTFLLLPLWSFSPFLGHGLPKSSSSNALCSMLMPPAYYLHLI